MANVNAPRGFVPVCDAHGNKYTAPGNRYYKGTTANTTIAVGDRVRRIQSTDPNGFPEIVRASVGGVCTGIVQSIDVVVTNLDQQGYYTSTQTGYLNVCDDPQIIFAVQEGGSGTLLTVAAIGQYVDSIAGTSDTTTGMSADLIDNNTLSTSSGEWRIVGLVQRPDNAVGQYAKWLVQRNESSEAVAGAANLSSALAS